MSAGIFICGAASLRLAKNSRASAAKFSARLSANELKTGAANHKSIRSIRYFLRDAAFLTVFGRIFFNCPHEKNLRQMRPRSHLPATLHLSAHAMLTATLKRGSI